ncbi:hypothetical protein HC352_06715 [Arcanobacterium buesumense]|uniref:Uncharacterized protein n=1 Tax=Arcanobacterium buesumense TaxID=2722751 RepID=A0A6H2EMF2_9ACTO|nr:hypothetical protein HC352_06715 [Arcanobacterium buesumense]
MVLDVMPKSPAIVERELKTGGQHACRSRRCP